MDLRRFEITMANGIFHVEAEDVVSHDGFVVFIRVDEESETTETVAMFNANSVNAVMEVTK